MNKVVSINQESNFNKEVSAILAMSRTQFTNPVIIYAKDTENYITLPTYSIEDFNLENVYISRGDGTGESSNYIDINNVGEDGYVTINKIYDQVTYISINFRGAASLQQDGVIPTDYTAECTYIDSNSNQPTITSNFLYYGSSYGANIVYYPSFRVFVQFGELVNIPETCDITVNITQGDQTFNRVIKIKWQ